MASRDLADLKATCRRRVEHMLALCVNEGVNMLVYCTLRSAEEQARLYRQGRNIRTIRGKASELRELNPALAELLIAVGPQHGAKVTAAGPGQSLHQYGWAADAAPIVDGKLIWDADAPQWQVYGSCAVAAGLEWAGNWRRFREYPHVQMPGKDWRDMIGGLRV